MLVLRLFTAIATAVIGLAFKIIFAAGGTLASLTVGAARPRSKTFGSARWATLLELILGGVWGGKGLIVGKKCGRFLRTELEGYAIIFAKTRAGKGVSLVIPNILDYKGSIICTDPKGENSAITARHRATMGPVFVLNAINPELSDHFNPLDMVRIGTYHEADDAQELATLLIIPDSSNGGHWDKRAGQLLKTLILFVCLRYEHEPHLRNLAKVRSLIALGAEGIHEIFEETRDLGSTSLREGMVSLKGLIETAEAQSVLANTEKAMDLWAADRPAGMISARSDFDLTDLNRKLMTVFVSIDEEKIHLYAGFLRVMMGCALIAMTRAKNEPRPETPTLFMLDEAAAMGYLDVLETGVGYLAAYARMMMFFQDMNQLQKTYPKAKSMIANAGAFIAFGIKELDSARMVSDMLGPRTVRSHSSSQSPGIFSLFKRATGENENETGRPLLDPSEVLRITQTRTIIFFNDSLKFPVLAKKVRYFKVRRWKGLWDEWRPRRRKVVPFPPQLPKPTQADEAA